MAVLAVQFNVIGLAEGPVLSKVEGPVLSKVEGPVLSLAEGPVLSLAEGPVLSKAEGPRSPHSQVSPQCTATSMMSTITNGLSTATGDRRGRQMLT